jgi:C-terminal processing protease CtpA/Prc
MNTCQAKQGSNRGAQQPHYSGKVVILVDETSMSQAEYTAMALGSVPGAIVVGSTTSGADGNVSSFPLPGTSALTSAQTSAS